MWGREVHALSAQDGLLDLPEDFAGLIGGDRVAVPEILSPDFPTAFRVEDGEVSRGAFGDPALALNAGDSGRRLGHPADDLGEVDTLLLGFRPEQ